MKPLRVGRANVILHYVFLEFLRLAAARPVAHALGQVGSGVGLQLEILEVWSFGCHKGSLPTDF